MLTAFNDKRVLVTGGAGSIGKAFAKHLIEHRSVKSVRIFDNSEYELSKMQREVQSPKLRFLLGDIRDRTRVQIAMKGVDTIIHLAAIKDIGVAAFNPIECIKTNVLGSINLIEEVMLNGVTHFCFVSTDKAVHPATLYGLSKAMGEQLMAWAHRVHDGVVWTAVRFGNVKQTKGNVFEIWKEGLPAPVTDLSCWRYLMDIEQCVQFLVEAVEQASGGEVFVPKMEEFQLKDLLYKEIGLREDEKLREQLYTPEEHTKDRMTEYPKMWRFRL